MYCRIIVTCLGITTFLFNSTMNGELQPTLMTQRVKDEQGVLNEQFLRSLIEFSKASVFIETGTYRGETAARAATLFDEVYTIELDKRLFERATNLYHDISNLHIYNGHSPDMIKQLLKTLPGKRISFWLDAHYSGPGTARRDSNTPILSELNAIRESGIADAIIMIDDIRIFAESDSMPSDITHRGYPSIETVVQTLQSIKPQYVIDIFDDIAIAIPH